MKKYCVKQRKQTDCVPGSEQYVVTKNGRNAMKCQCAECGITKFSFVKGSATGTTKAKKPRTTKPRTTKPRKPRTTKPKTGSGLLLGRNSPFRSIPLIGAIL